MSKKILKTTLLTLVIISTLLTGCAKTEIPSYEPISPSISVEEDSFITQKYDGQDYVILGEKYNGTYVKTYSGEHDVQNVKFNTDEKEGLDWYDFNKTEVLTFGQYTKFCQEWNVVQKYTDESKKYVIISYGNTWSDSINVRLSDIKTEDKTITVFIREDVSYEKPQNDNECIGYFLAIPVDNDINKLDISLIVSLEEYIDIYNTRYTVDKPIIYLYPKETTELTITLGNKRLLTHSYPKYIDGWNIIANPNGDLVDLDTGRSLYSLYYESKPVTDIVMTDEGFIVKGEDTIEFLEEKLAILGLNEREAQEFIIYWLPKLEANEYNYIRFASQKEIEANMPLNFFVEPDTLIRVWMEFKGLDTPIEINEQELVTPQREGFVVVEWGGTEIR